MGRELIFKYDVITLSECYKFCEFVISILSVNAKAEADTPRDTDI